MYEHKKIIYVELPSKDIQATKDFLSQVFGRPFQDFGPEYLVFSN
jgi:predicted enzyme related to lactoylglutathione lyase